MNTIHLYGALRKEFGASHSFEVGTVTDAVDALRANFGNFFNAIRNGHYRIVSGKTRGNGVELSEAMLPGFRLGEKDLHIVPVIKGSKRGGLGKIIAGIALIGLSVMTGGAIGAIMGTTMWGGSTIGAMLGSIGTGMLLSGVAAFIAPQQESSDDKKSYTMSGPQVTTREGGIIPIAYGEVITGGTMINGALSIRGTNDNSISSRPGKGSKDSAAAVAGIHGDISQFVGGDNFAGGSNG